MTLQEFEKGLKEACPDLVFELAGPKGSHRYVCWHRYGAGSIHGDNRNQLNAPRVQIDIHTQSLSDTLVEDVCAALWMMDLPYFIVSEGYDDDYADLRTILQLVVV
ncbi:MAG: hypothetical protein J6V25_07765 [Oscillospiraceae bacterium]|nr:hypothetical protein [Oscillospiraceae bacterium]